MGDAIVSPRDRADASPRVLVVDDDEMNRMLLARMLATIGYPEVRTVSGAAELAEIVGDFDPALLLLDLHLGDRDGFEVLRELARDDTGFDHRKVLLVTGDPVAATRPDAGEVGIRGVLAKPYDVASLQAAVRDVLDSANGSAADTTSSLVSVQSSGVDVDGDQDTEQQPETIAELRQQLLALRELNEELRAANQTKAEFLGRVSHELRTPLTAILGFSELLAMADIPEQQQEWVRITVQAGRHLLRLLNDVLDISSGETGNLSLSVEPVAVEPLMRDVCELARPLADAKEITLDDSRVGPTGRRYVLADHQRLRQALLNLLSNAVKYNDVGGGVGVGVSETSDDRIRIEVTDTGRGISAADLVRLFTPFERLDAASAGFEGTGLGLALSRDLVEHMGGTLGVDSTLGEGSTFWIELVAVEPSAIDPVDAASPAAIAMLTYAEPKTVLYIEDMVANVKLIEQILTRRPNIRLIPAMLGGTGIELAREHQPDLILLDLHLPDMGGEHVLARLRSDAATADIPIVVLTADATSSQTEHLLEAGATAYLTKPIHVSGLLQVLDDSLG